MIKIDTGLKSVFSQVMLANDTKAMWRVFFYGAIDHLKAVQMYSEQSYSPNHSQEHW